LSHITSTPWDRFSISRPLSVVENAMRALRWHACDRKDGSNSAAMRIEKPHCCVETIQWHGHLAHVLMDCIAWAGMPMPRELFEGTPWRQMVSTEQNRIPSRPDPGLKSAAEIGCAGPGIGVNSQSHEHHARCVWCLLEVCDQMLVESGRRAIQRKPLRSVGENADRHIP
jgi:hypothetical protein